jgi:hypothetical protein
MIMKNTYIAFISSILLITSAHLFAETDQQKPDQNKSEIPQFIDIFNLVKTNLPTLTESELNKAALFGFVKELSPMVRIETNSVATTSPGNTNIITQKKVFDDYYGYIRISSVTDSLANQIAMFLKEYNSTKSLKGLIIDLRYADGNDYQESAKAVDLFVTSPRQIISWENNSISTTSKTNAFTEPVVVLVNSQTIGAAEIFAAALRELNVALIIGRPTSGKAAISKKYPITSGLDLVISNIKVQVNGKPIPESGIVPDISVNVDPGDEKAYYDDPYKVINRSLAILGITSTNANSGATTNRPFRRINEAELVKIHKGEETLDSITNQLQSLIEAKPTVQDPDLARGLDLLKGLAVVRSMKKD